MFVIALLGLLGIGLVVDLVGSDDDDQETADVIDCNAIEAESGTTVDTNETDFIAGGDGENRIFGSDGNDFIAGGEADDQLFGCDGNDDIYGEAGDDFIRGSADDDYLVGGAGNDTLYGDTGNDTLISNDVLDDEAFVTSVFARSELVIDYDFSDEAAEADTLFGGSGDDVLFIGGNDVANTGSGNDVVSTAFWIEAGEQAIVTDFVQGEDTLVYNYDETQPEPVVSFSENADSDAQFLINGDVVMVLSNVDYTTLTTNDVRLFAV